MDLQNVDNLLNDIEKENDKIGFVKMTPAGIIIKKDANLENYDFLSGQKKIIKALRIITDHLKNN